MTKSSVTYQNHQISCFTAGSGEAIVFLHGWPTNAMLWKAQLDALKTDYKVITLDWLGFGRSDKPADHDYTFTDQKEILNTVLSSLLKKEEQVSIIAHDIGGPPAILWASENEERVKRLILLNTVIFPFSTLLDKVSHYFFDVPVIKDLLVSPFGLRTLMKTLSKSKDTLVKNRIEEVLAAHEKVSNEVRLKTILAPLKAAKQNEFKVLSRKFSSLNNNKYLVIAKEDPLCYKHIKQLSEENPEVPVYDIENCGHFIPIDRPDALNDVLMKILKERIDNV